MLMSKCGGQTWRIKRTREGWSSDGCAWSAPRQDVRSNSMLCASEHVAENDRQSGKRERESSMPMPMRHITHLSLLRQLIQPASPARKILRSTPRRLSQRAYLPILFHALALLAQNFQYQVRDCSMRRTRTPTSRQRYRVAMCSCRGGTSISARYV